MISIDEIFEWTGGVNGWGKFLSKCRIRIIETPFRVVVVATELPDNGGASITNAVEHLALLVCRRWGISPQKLIWIEHYMRRSVGAVVYEEECDRVEMRWERGFFDNPRWYRLPSGALDDILVAGDVPALEGQRGSGDRVRFFDEDQDDAVNL